MDRDDRPSGSAVPAGVATLLGFAGIFGALQLWRSATGGFPWLVLGVLLGTLLVLGLLTRRGVMRSAPLTGTWVGALWALLLAVVTRAQVAADQDATFVVAMVGALTGVGVGLLVAGSRARMQRLGDQRPE